MTMNLFLQQLAFTFLTQAIPTGVAIYFGIRLALSHGEASFVRRKAKKDES